LPHHWICRATIKEAAFWSAVVLLAAAFWSADPGVVLAGGFCAVVELEAAAL
jgi:hypothetical protein